MFLKKIRKHFTVFHLKIIIFTETRSKLHRRVFVVVPPFIAQWIERRPSNPFEPMAGTDIYAPAMLRSEYLLASKGYTRHDFRIRLA